MNDIADTLLPAVAIGIGATAVMDIWTIALKRLFGVPALDYRLVGRWLAYLARGRCQAIAAAPPVKGEQAIGWAAHYAIGIIYAAALLAIWGPGWAREPSLAPAFIVGLSTVLAPFLILQPVLGAGIAAARTPRPNIARLKSIATHLSFAIGLVIAARAWSWMTGG